MKSKSFTMVELLVVMAIIAVLIGLSVFGIGQLNKNSRDSQRLNTLAEMVLELNDYKKENLNYPATAEVVFNTNFRIAGVNIFPLTGSNDYAATTSTSGTRYEYANNNGKFGLCAIMESGEVKNVGEIDIDCI